MQSKKTKKGLIIGTCAVVLVAAIIVVLLLCIKREPELNDSYFVSDDEKYVLNLSSDDVSFKNEKYAPLKTHMVYKYADNKITGLTIYYEYANAESAKAALEQVKSEERDDIEETKLNGRFIEMTTKETKYADLTADEVKQNLQLIELLKKMDQGTSDYEYDIFDSGSDFEYSEF